jgi:predicted TIM-barrel fold metal-dependent hydrolase
MKNIHAKTFTALIFTTGLWSVSAMGAAARGDAPYDVADFARVEKIDTHMHLYGELPEFVKRAKADNVRVLTINVNYRDFPPLQTQERDAIALRHQYPGRIAFAATFDAAGSDQPEWLARTQSGLQNALRQGAVGVKVWKDIGMQQRDPDGHAVMIDDPRFAPVFSMLEKRRIPVLGHQGEPLNAWLALDKMTIKGDRDYFTEHPQYHMFAHPEWPSYEQQIAARDRMLDQHPKMRFVGVHLASLEYDVAKVADFLRRYPNASVDVAARLVHLQLQASRDREAVRQFFIEFQDRILYGTDVARGRDEPDEDVAKEAHEAWLADWNFLVGDAELHSGDFEAPFTGLALPASVIDKVYHGNARRAFPRAWSSK